MIMTGILAAWREVRLIVISLCSLSFLTALTKKRWLALIPLTLLGWVAYFFRDPERLPAIDAPNVIVSPADGTITHIELTEDPLFFKGPVKRISMFLSLFNVHVQRIPYQGQLQFLHYQPGEFAPAFLKDTHNNEYNYIGLQTPHGRLGVKQITGILARRIICWPGIGDSLATGERYGLIKFGSRVDLLLPPEVEIEIEAGQKVYGGQTIVAKWPTP